MTEGSISPWSLSPSLLQGDPGSDGATGAKGEPGNNGMKGDDGDPGMKGDMGNPGTYMCTRVWSRYFVACLCIEGSLCS